MSTDYLCRFACSALARDKRFRSEGTAVAFFVVFWGLYSERLRELHE